MFLIAFVLAHISLSISGPKTLSLQDLPSIVEIYVGMPHTDGQITPALGMAERNRLLVKVNTFLSAYRRLSSSDQDALLLGYLTSLSRRLTKHQDVLDRQDNYNKLDL